MKPPVVVMLLIMGTLLILAPIGADYLFQRNVVSVLIKAASPSLALIERLGGWYRIACWLSGSLMIGIGIGIIGGAIDGRGPYYVDTIDDTDEEDDDDEPQNKKQR